MPEKTLVTIITIDRLYTQAEVAPDSEKSSYFITNRIEPSVYDTLRDKTFREIMPYITKLPPEPTSHQLEIQSTIQNSISIDESPRYIADSRAGTTQDNQYNVLQIMCRDKDGNAIRSPDGSRPFAVQDDGISHYISEINVDEKSLDHLDMSLAMRFMNARR